MVFADRADAGRKLAVRLAHLRGEPLVVLGVPRGGVPVALELARALGAPLDVTVVRRLGVPFAAGATARAASQIAHAQHAARVRLPPATDDEVIACLEREPGTLDAAAALARDWFISHLTRTARPVTMPAVLPGKRFRRGKAS